jgi:hypothetical protein
MKLKDDVNAYNSLYGMTLRWARTSSDLLPFDPDYIQSLNVWVKRAEALIKRNDGWWIHADSNLTSEDLVDYLDLTVNVRKYALDSSWSMISGVRILENDGVTYRTLEEKSRDNITDAELNADGDVRYYYVLGGYLWLAGKPSYSQTNGIEVTVQKRTYPFTPSDADKEVGFDPLFEEIAILGPALDYLDMNGPEEQAVKVRNRIGQEPIGNVPGTGLLGALAVFYSERLDEQPELEIERSDRAQGLQIDSVGSTINPTW